MENKAQLKLISYTCPLCKKIIDTYVDVDEFSDKEFPIAITDLHEVGTDKHANTLFIDEQFIIRAVETADFASVRISEESGSTTKIKEKYVPIPKSNIINTNIGFIENLLLTRIDGYKSTEDLAIELKISEKRVRLLAKKLHVHGLISEVKWVIK